MRRLPLLHSPDADQHFITRVEEIQLRRRQLFDYDAVQEGRRRKDIAVRVNRNRCSRENFPQERACRGCCQSPLPVFSPFIGTFLTDAGKGCKENTARFQNPGQRAQRRPNIVDEMQRLEKQDAIERVRGNLRRVRDIADESCLRVAGLHVQNVAAVHTFAAKAPGVFVIADLQYSAADIRLIQTQEAINVVPVYGRSAIESELPADGCQSAQRTEVDSAATTSEHFNNLRGQKSLQGMFYSFSHAT